MTQFIVGGAVRNAPALKPFSKFRKAAPLIDKVGALITEGINSYEGQIALTTAILGVFEVACEGAPDQFNAAHTIDQMDYSEMDPLVAAYVELLTESGLRKADASGEAPAAAATQA